LTPATAWNAPGAGARLYVKIALAMGLLALATELVYLAASPLPFDPVGYRVGRDFVNTWMGARAALTGDPSPWFGFTAYNAALQQMFGADYPMHLWGYPPHLLLFTWPLGLLPYFPAYVLWVVLGLAAYLFIAADGERRLGHLALLVFAPAVVVNIGFGQTGFVLAALMIGGLVNLDRRPVLAGIMFGLLTVKPHFGIFLPLMLVLTGRWRVIAVAATTGAVLLVVTSLVFGLHVWSAYLDVVVPVMTRSMSFTGFFLTTSPTAFMNMRLAGFSIDAAFAAQAVLSIVAVVTVIWTFLRRRDPALSMALLVTATFVALPYAYNYDMVVFGWVIALLLDRDDNEVFDYVLMLAVLTLPVTVMLLWFFAGLPISSFVLIAFLASLVRRLRQSGEARNPRASGGLVPAGPGAISAP
jgi:hypothetical protein